MQIFSQISQFLNKDLGRSNHMPALLLHWHADTKIIEWCGVSECVPLWYRVKTGIVETFPKLQGVPLGLSAHATFDSRKTKYSLSEGDTILLYTDGIIEAKNRKNQQFGIERLQHEFLTGIASPLDKLVQNLFQSVWRHMGKADDDIDDERDDITLVALRCSSSKFCQGKIPIEITPVTTVEF
jgi:serine phosphatase RsbU (regulator of sigma subunit)